MFLLLMELCVKVAHPWDESISYESSRERQKMALARIGKTFVLLLLLVDNQNHSLVMSFSF